MTQKIVTVNGMLKDINDNFADIMPVGTDYGNGVLRVARALFDATGGKATGAHNTGVTIPAGAIIVGGFVKVNTTFTDGDTDAATIAIHTKTANDIITATAISSGTSWDAGKKAIVPKANTPESTGIDLAAATPIVVTVAGVALTAGKMNIYLYYVEGD